MQAARSLAVRWVANVRGSGMRNRETFPRAVEEVAATPVAAVRLPGTWPNDTVGARFNRLSGSRCGCPSHSRHQTHDSLPNCIHSAVDFPTAVRIGIWRRSHRKRTAFRLQAKGFRLSNLIRWQRVLQKALNCEADTAIHNGYLRDCEVPTSWRRERVTIRLSSRLSPRDFWISRYGMDYRKSREMEECPSG